MTAYALELRSAPTPPRELRSTAASDALRTDDVALARRLALGDAAAAETVYRRTLPSIYAYVRARLRDPSDAEDVVQDVYLTALRVVGGFDGRSSFLTWLTGVARNKTRERVRAKVRARRREAAADDAARALLDLEIEAPPDALLASKETAALVADALALVPDRLRRALRMKYVDGASLAEIAAAEGVSTKAAESLVVRARRAFAKIARTLARRRLGEDTP